MITSIFPGAPDRIVYLVAMALAFVLTFVFLGTLKDRLPRDQGREFAVNGKLSAGKARGAGSIFVAVFMVIAMTFCDVDTELQIYALLTFVTMLTGYLDDAAKAPWGEYKKGLLDLIIAIITAVTYLRFNGSTVSFAIIGGSIQIPAVLFGILTVVLIWAAINVTNCSDGVDGLSASVSIITLMSFYKLMQIRDVSANFRLALLVFVMVLIAYLWYNATPSIMMMGDAGSRAMGFFIALAALKSGCPFMFLPLAIVLIIDGGLGLIKVALLRFLKIKILVNTRTPIHDHVRKVKDWSNTQCVFRFVIIQIFVSVVAIYLVR